MWLSAKTGAKHGGELRHQIHLMLAIRQLIWHCTLHRRCMDDWEGLDSYTDVLQFHILTFRPPIVCVPDAEASRLEHSVSKTAVTPQMASIPNANKSAPPVKESKKHAEMLRRASEANVSTRIGKGTRATLEVQRSLRRFSPALLRILDL